MHRVQLLLTVMCLGVFAQTQAQLEQPLVGIPPSSHTAIEEVSDNAGLESTPGKLSGELDDQEDEGIGSPLEVSEGIGLHALPPLTENLVHSPTSTLPRGDTPPLYEEESVLSLSEAHVDPFTPSDTQAFKQQEKARDTAQAMFEALKKRHVKPFWKRFFTTASREKMTYLNDIFDSIDSQEDASVKQAMLTLLYEERLKGNPPLTTLPISYESFEEALSKGLTQLLAVLEKGDSAHFDDSFNKTLAIAIESIERTHVNAPAEKTYVDPNKARPFDTAYITSRETRNQSAEFRKKGRESALALRKSYLSSPSEKTFLSYYASANKVGKFIENPHERLAFFNTILTQKPEEFSENPSLRQKIELAKKFQIAAQYGVLQKCITEDSLLLDKKAADLSMLDTSKHEKAADLPMRALSKHEKAAQAAALSMRALSKFEGAYQSIRASLILIAPLHGTNLSKARGILSALPATLLSEDGSLLFKELMKARKILGENKGWAYLAPATLLATFNESALDLLEATQIKVVEKRLLKNKKKLEHLVKTQTETLAQRIIATVMEREENSGGYYADAHTQSYQKTLDTLTPHHPYLQATIIRQLQEIAKASKLGSEKAKVQQLLDTELKRTHDVMLKTVPIVLAKKHTPLGTQLITKTPHNPLLTQGDAFAKAHAIITETLPSTKNREYYARFYEEILKKAADQNPQIQAALKTIAAQMYYADPAKTPIKEGYAPGALYGWASSTLWWTTINPKTLTGLQKELQIKNPAELQGLPSPEDIVTSHYVNNNGRLEYEGSIRKSITQAAQESLKQVAQTHDVVIEHLDHLAETFETLKEHLHKNLGLDVSTRHIKKKQGIPKSLEAISSIDSTILRISTELAKHQKKNTAMVSAEAQRHLESITTFSKQLHLLPADLGPNGHLSQLNAQLKAVTSAMMDHMQRARNYENVHVSALTHLDETLGKGKKIPATTGHKRPRTVTFQVDPQ